jgi:hypothetical protein
MSTLKENVQKVVDANAAIKAAIAAKGVTVPAAAKLSDAAALIASIAGGIEFVDGAYVTVTCSLSSSSSYAMYGDMAFCSAGDARMWSAYAGATKVTESGYTYTADGTKIYTSPMIDYGASDSAVLPLTEAAQKAMVAAGVTSINIVCGSCLRPGTPVRMADGTERRIEDVRVGDLVLSVDPETGGLVPDRVVAAPRGVGRAWDEWTFSDGTVVGTVGRHRFWNADLGEFMYLEAWNEGEQALSFADASDRFGPLLVSRVHHDEESEHHTLFTEKYNNYFAAGLLAGNRKSARGRWL